MLEPITAHCPYCGEAFDTSVDCSAGTQRYVEDCQVCCQPIEFIVEVNMDGSLAGVSFLRDDD